MRAPLKRLQNFQSKGKVGTWYNIKNISSDVASIYIYDEIGMWGVTASDFATELRGITAPTIELHISSPGGDVFDGLAILNGIRQHSAHVDVIIDGIAASAASFIAMAGDTIKMSPQAQMMIHDAFGLVIGNSRDMREMAEMLEKTSDNIAAVYAQRAGGTVEEWRSAMRAETWYSDQEAVDAGLADEVIGAKADEKSADAPTNVAAPQLTDEAPDAWDFDIASLVKEATQ